MMKRIYIILVLIVTSISVSARVFEAGEKLYFNAKPNDATFWKNGTAENTVKLWGRLVNTKENKEYWLEAKWYESDNCYLEMPNDAFLTGREWDKLVLYRCAYNNRNTVHNQTGQIDIDCNYDKNYIQNFYYGTYHEGANWWNLTFVPSGNPTNATKVDNVTKEVISVCKSSIGDPLSLQAVIAGYPLSYDYDHSAGNAWFKWNGSSWVALDGQSTGFYHENNSWGYEGGTKIKETIGAANSKTYYFLWTEKPSHRRFVEVDVDRDCSLTSEITDFGAVTSSVNAHDSTYVLDGIVAFKSANGNTLRISVTDAKGEHHVDYVDPSTPLIFSLKGLFADGTKNLTAKAEFIGTTYSATTKFDAPNAVTGISTKESTISQKETKKIIPSTDGAGGFTWHDPSITEHEPVIGPFDRDTTIIYTYYEFETPPSVAGNLIENGDFSADKSFYGTENRTNTNTGSAISEYNFWGKDIATDGKFYDTYKIGDKSISGGFAIVKDANEFWKRFTKKITPMASTHFALFDADDSGTKKAWKIDTSKSSKLTLAKGTNYMFSFWVANINNYGEMNNAAILQFAIRYKKNGSWGKEELLGKPINLNEYKDNLWHQNSHVFTSTVDATEVEIMVRDLNESSNPGGNDFALDDIKFQPISVVSQAIKNCERFVVHIYETPTVVDQPQIKITQTPACGKTDFTMQVKVSYSTLNNKYPITLQLTDNIYGPLFATPITINPAVNPNNITIDLPTATYAFLVADGKTHTLKAKITRIDGAGVDKGGENSATYVSPGVPTIHKPVLTITNPACDKTTFDLKVETEYLAFKGSKLRYDWDGTEWTDVTTDALSYKESTWQKSTGTLKNLVADGKTHNIRVYSDNTVLDCEFAFDTIAHYSPKVTVVPNATVQTYSCSDNKYKVKVETSFANGQGHKLIIEDWNGHTDTLTTIATDTKKDTILEYSWEAPTARQFKVYFEGAESCKNDHVISFTSPYLPVIDVVKVTDVPTTVPCGTTAYKANVSVTPRYPTTSGNVVLTYDSLGTSKSVTIAITAFPYSISLYNMTPGPHNISAAFEGHETCKKDSTYAGPSMTKCVRDTITKCEGDSAFWYITNKYYKGDVGEHKFADGADSLWLFIIANPTISFGTATITCDDQAKILLPITSTAGSPDSIEVKVGTNTYTATIVGSDLSFSRASELVAGDYTATITVGKKGTSCTSETNVSFSVALGGTMLSKWTDVLFIDNKAGQFVAYQWYENGVALTGETQQRLYNPAGLPGNYYCELTMSDGKKVKTCEQTFGDVQPSREANNETPSQEIRRYRVSPHVYIIQIKTGNEIETKKIMTPYE